MDDERLDDFAQALGWEDFDAMREDESGCYHGHGEDRVWMSGKAIAVALVEALAG